jgi:hypothetical protein
LIWVCSDGDDDLMNMGSVFLDSDFWKKKRFFLNCFSFWKKKTEGFVFEFVNDLGSGFFLKKRNEGFG